MRPRSDRPRASAGTRLAASTAWTRSIPMLTRLRIAASRVREDPASRPSPRRGGSPSAWTCTGTSASRYLPGGIPAAAVASVTSATRPDAARSNGADLRRDVVQVGDESDREAGIRERLPGDARLAVTERTLGVEDVRDARRAGVGSRGHVRSDGLGVPERHPHAGVDDARWRRWRWAFAQSSAEPCHRPPAKGVRPTPDRDRS